MKRLNLVILIALVCGLAAQRSQPLRGAASDPLLHILQSELQRNFDGLRSQPVPPYFLSYTVHDTRTTSMRASFGALERSDDDGSLAHPPRRGLPHSEDAETRGLEVGGSAAHLCRSKIECKDAARTGHA